MNKYDMILESENIIYVRLSEYLINDYLKDGFELNVYETNPRAIHCYEKVGFIKDGVGKTEDDIHMILKK